MLDHDNSVFLCIRCLRDTIRNMAQFLRNHDKNDNRFSIGIGSCFKMDAKQNMLNTVITNKKNCPLSGGCLKESLVCYATISCNEKNYKLKQYKKSWELSFKKHCNNHKKSFNVPLYKHDNKLSTEYWNLKPMHLISRISWKTSFINQLQKSVT